jgi:hypothetical protein
MKIEFRYFRAGEGGFYESPGKLILSGRKVKPADKSASVPAGEEVNYSPVKTWLALPMQQGMVRKPVNYLFTEEGYRLGQKEFLAYLGWFQQQKLKWMYRDHWLQRPGNLTHTIFFIVLVALAITGIMYLESSGLF